MARLLLRLRVPPLHRRRAWPGEDAVGRRLGMGRREPTWHTVVGVVGDINRNRLDQPADPEMHLSTLQRGIQSAQVVVRTDGPAAAMAACYVPARRAGRADPMLALRAD